MYSLTLQTEKNNTIHFDPFTTIKYSFCYTYSDCYKLNANNINALLMQHSDNIQEKHVQNLT